MENIIKIISYWKSFSILEEIKKLESDKEKDGLLIKIENITRILPKFIIKLSKFENI